MLYLRKYLLLIKMNKILTIILAGFLAVSCHDYDVLRFDPSDYTEEMIVIKNDTIRFRAYEHICYVENPEDTAFQTLNIYVPDNGLLTLYMYTPSSLKAYTTSLIDFKCVLELITRCILIEI